MALDVEPGSKVSVKLKKAPKSEAAAKTLSRVFGKDLADRGARKRRKKLRADHILAHRRGGRPWYYRPKAPRLSQPAEGATCTVLATVDVIADLKSVQRFIEVKAAK